ncbi:MAG: hypothetical protein QM500_00790 [Methylococcales bacterium]
MSDFISFEPKARKEAKKNLEEFIRLCRDELIYYDSKDTKFNWNNWYWKGDVKDLGVMFIKQGVNQRQASERDAFSMPFIDFAKAYLRYRMSNKPTINTKGQTIKALRSLEMAYIESGRESDITQLTEDILDEAELNIKNHYATTSAYQGGKQLEVLAEFVSNKNISETYLDWSHSCSRAKDNNKTGIEGKKNREKKLPTQDALDALAEVFGNKPTNENDVLVTSTVAMLLCQPARISEVLRLRIDCADIDEEFLKYVDSDGRKKTGYGWRFNAAKGYDPEIKWIPTSLQGIAKEAIQRIIELSQPARDFAVLMEKVINSKKPSFPRHPLCPDVPDNQILTRKEVGLALGYESVSKANSKREVQTSVNHLFRGISSFGSLPADDLTLNDLTELLIEKLPKNFPWVDKKRGIKYSNSLFVFFYQQTLPEKSTIRTILWKPYSNILNNSLSAKNKWNNWFGKHGYNEGRDNFLFITSHMFRHYLNTLAQDGELTQEEIAKWSGRKDIGQNAVYNHESHEDRVNQLRKYNMDKSLMGGDLDIEINAPITNAEFFTLERAPVHSSEFGFCEHLYYLSPCMKFRDCANCEEEVCIKGDIESLERLKLFSNKLKLVVERDEENIKNGELDKDDQSYLYHKLKLFRVTQKIKILESDDVQDGAEIRLKNPMATTEIERALESRKRKGLDSRNNNVINKAVKSANKKRDELRELLGGGLG